MSDHALNIELPVNASEASFGEVLEQFQKVSQMNASEVVAAYNAAEFFMKNGKLEESGPMSILLESLKKAILEQMGFIVRKQFKSDRHQLAVLFAQTTSVEKDCFL